MSSIRFWASFADIFLVKSIWAISASDWALIRDAILSDSASKNFKNFEFTLFFDLLFLLCNVEKCFLCFNLFVVFHQTFWYLWLGDSNTNDFNTRSPSSCTLRQWFGQLLVKSVKFVNEDVLESVFTAELVDLMAVDVSLFLRLLTGSCQKSMFCRSWQCSSWQFLGQVAFWVCSPLRFARTLRWLRQRFRKERYLLCLSAQLPERFRRWWWTETWSSNPAPGSRPIWRHPWSRLQCGPPKQCAHLKTQSAAQLRRFRVKFQS